MVADHCMPYVALQCSSYMCYVDNYAATDALKVLNISIAEANSKLVTRLFSNCKNLQFVNMSGITTVGPSVFSNLRSSQVKQTSRNILAATRMQLQRSRK
jgi:hypothetical protein